MIDVTEPAGGEAPLGVRRIMSTSPSIAPASSDDNPVLPQPPAKKRSRFWNILRRSRRPPALPQCSEDGEDTESIASVEASGCFSRGGICSRNDGHHHHSADHRAKSGAAVGVSQRGGRGRDRPDSPSLGGLRSIGHLSLGVGGSRPFRLLADTQLMTVVVPAPPRMRAVNDVGGARSHNPLVDPAGEPSSSKAAGYPHLQFSQSLSSSSSSSSSSGISAPAPAPLTPDYPPFCTAAPTVHTQVDYMHCLVPDLLELTNRTFYWGVMDRYEAEKLLDGRPEGTFLVRDSAQEEFLFSVSFRRYGRSLHARIEQWNHRFSFDSHDLGVFAAPSVCALVEHYKDPAACMFFEPMLTLPLPRSRPFSLQRLCRAVICSRIRYDDISSLRLPARIHDYLKYYHYKQRICVRRFECRGVLAE